jgi:predicted nuclease of predicted toxin-antitoxin system
MSYARDNDYIVVTHDLDFSTILSVTHGQKPSVIQIRVQNFNSEQFAELIALAVMQNANELEQGAILSIDAHKSRLCMLPFL